MQKKQMEKVAEEEREANAWLQKLQTEEAHKHLQTHMNFRIKILGQQGDSIENALLEELSIELRWTVEELCRHLEVLLKLPQEMKGKCKLMLDGEVLDLNASFERLVQEENLEEGLQFDLKLPRKLVG
eukprot:GHVT01095962.1.p1 GENE.GHVT01095962.1~~GHVT01095962.1.p1  ORF type:complete len:128 (+),score=28.45 GHVT01095962.1:54-437(+)